MLKISLFEQANCEIIYSQNDYVINLTHDRQKFREKINIQTLEWKIFETTNKEKRFFVSFCICYPLFKMWQILLVIFLGLLTWLYIRVQKKFDYFASKGIAQDPGFFPFGSNSSWKMTTGKLAFTKLTDETYEKFPKEKIVGWYGPFGEPALIVRDLDIAKAVLIKDFDHFVDRRKMDLSKKTNQYFLEMLFSMTGDKWKRMRAILSPVFTSGKLRAMIPMMNQVLIF